MSRAYISWYMANVAENSEYYYQRKITRRNIRDANNPFELNDTEFHMLFRISKSMATYLVEEVDNDLHPRKRFGLPTYIQVLCALRFLVVGSYQRGIGQDYGICVGQRTVSKCLDRFTKSVVRRLMATWIKFPGHPSARRAVAEGFEDKFGLPNILGCIDCTHVAIFPPSEHASAYVNRKSFHSINVQIISDVNCSILSVNAKFPGRVHDQFIFNNCIVKREMERLHNNRMDRFYLIGDSGYALEPWLMTPILNAREGSPEERYTNRICQIRNCVERLNGYLKGVFRCLRRDRVLHYKPEKASYIIYSCCVIYNIMLHYRINIPEPEFDGIDEGQTMLHSANPIQDPILQVAREAQRHIIHTHFQ